MTQPIGSYGRSYNYSTQEDDRTTTTESNTSKIAREMCLKADTVAEGFLCDEPTVVSNACRSSTNDFDKFICDDKRMADVQQGIWRTTKDVLKAMFTALIGAGKK